MRKKLIIFLILAALGGFHISAQSYMLEDPGVEIHGFISQGFLKSTSYNYLANDTNKGSFQFNEMGINFNKKVTPKLRIGAQLFARDLGDIGNNRISLDWAHGDYRLWDWLGIRAGRLKIPLGLYNDIRDVDLLRSCIILPQGIYNELNRDTMIAMNGGALYGMIPMAVAGSLEYQALVGVGNMDADSGIGKHISNSFGGARLSNYNTDIGYIGSLRWNTPLSGLALKASYWRSDSSTMPLTLGTTSLSMSMKNQIQVYSAEFIWKDLTLAAEYQTVMSDYDIRTTAGSLIRGGTQRAENYYLMAGYRLTNWLEAGAYYTEIFPNAGSSEKNGDHFSNPGQHNFWAWQKDAAVFARFDINGYMIIKLEGHYVDGTANVLSVDNPTRDDRNWWYFATKVTFSF